MLNKEKEGNHLSEGCQFYNFSSDLLDAQQIERKEESLREKGNGKNEEKITGKGIYNLEICSKD